MAFSRSRLGVFLGWLLLQLACVSPSEHIWLFAKDNIQFQDVSGSSNITFEHHDGSSGAHYLIEAIASGVATFDYDCDGDLDIYFLDGAGLQGTNYSPRPMNRLYRNDGSMTFTDVTDASGLGDPSFSLGVAVGDLNDDGLPDVYVSNFGPNKLYLNNGDGTFREDASSVPACGNKVGAGITLLDIENDGDLDIYAASYIKFDYETHPESKFNGRVVYGGPVLFKPEPDDLLRNNGDGTYSNISKESGISELAEWGMGTIGIDMENDGDTDIFVANDSTLNFLWENDGEGNFSETALLAGIAYDQKGEAQGSMGVDAADIEGDGFLDLFQTAYENQSATLYSNVGAACFQDATQKTGAGSGTTHLVNWGTCFGDFDNDGDPDLFVVNGHIHDNQDEFNDRTKYKIKNQIFQNIGRGRFVDSTTDCGTALQAIESSRGVATEDFDGDGKLDVLIVNSRTSPQVLKNVSASGNNWVKVTLIGSSVNRSAVGSQVQVTTSAGKQLQEVHAGRGYQSHFGTSLHFGIADSIVVDEIEVRWLGGESEKFTNVKVGASIVIRQGKGITYQESPE